MRGAYDAAGVQVTDAELWRLVGVTPMIGQNDVMSERFYIEDAEKLLDFADEVGMGFLSAWSANRDAPCETFGHARIELVAVFPRNPLNLLKRWGNSPLAVVTQAVVTQAVVTQAVVTVGMVAIQRAMAMIQRLGDLHGECLSRQSCWSRYRQLQS